MPDGWVQPGKVFHNVTPGLEISEVDPISEWKQNLVYGTRNSLANPSQPLARTGSLIRTGLFNFYERLYGDPVNSVVFGAITGEKIIALPVWNAFLHYPGIDIEEVTKTNLSDSEIWDQILPTIFQRLEYKLQNVRALATGTATVSGSFSLKVDSQQSNSNYSYFTITVSGIRAAVFSWYSEQSDIEETLSWLTKINTSENGKEQSISLRPNPRRQIKTSSIIAASKDHLINARSRALFRNQLRVFQGGGWIVPIIQDSIQLVSNFNTGNTILNMNTVGRDFDIGQSVMFWNSPLNYELLTVQSLTGSQITFTSGASKNWKPGTKVIPCRTAYLGKELQIDSITDTLDALSLTWELRPEDISTNRIGVWNAPTYLTYPVFERKPQFYANARERFTSARIITELDFRTGVLSTETDTPTAQDRFEHHVFLKDRTEISAFLGWLYQQKGQHRLAWYSTWTHDFQIYEAMSNNTTMRIWYASFSNALFSKGGRRDVMIRTVDGVNVYRRIQNAIDNGDGSETLTFSTSLPALYTPSQIERISFLRLASFSDNVKLRWLPGSKCAVVLNLTDQQYT